MFLCKSALLSSPSRVFCTQQKATSRWLNHLHGGLRAHTERLGSNIETSRYSEKCGQLERNRETFTKPGKCKKNVCTTKCKSRVPPRFSQVTFEGKTQALCRGLTHHMCLNMTTSFIHSTLHVTGVLCTLHFSHLSLPDSEHTGCFF